MAGVLQSGPHRLKESRNRVAIHQITDHDVTSTGSATSRAGKAQSVHSPNPLTVNAWFYQFLSYI